MVHAKKRHPYLYMGSYNEEGAHCLVHKIWESKHPTFVDKQNYKVANHKGLWEPPCDDQCDMLSIVVFPMISLTIEVHNSSLNLETLALAIPK